MAELTIELSRAGPCGRFQLRIGYRADADAIPHEHEMHHRCLVQTLLPGVEIIDAPEAAVRVQREKPAQEPVVG